MASLDQIFKPSVDHLSFGDYHFKEPSYPNGRIKTSSDGYSSMSLQMCTEGLGFESSDQLDWKPEIQPQHHQQQQQESKKTRNNFVGNSNSDRRASEGGFPPPISSIGKSGKPWVCFESYRQDGRFVLKEMRIPTQEVLQASRQDGRLKLNFVQSDDDNDDVDVNDNYNGEDNDNNEANEITG